MLLDTLIPHSSSRTRQRQRTIVFLVTAVTLGFACDIPLKHGARNLPNLVLAAQSAATWNEFTMRIVFCGSTFPDATEYLRQALPATGEDELLVWSGESLDDLPADVDVLIPKMHPVGSALMDARKLRLIQQWGAGLEGVDLEAAKARGIAVANLPATGDNANSVAEHAILLVLSLLRNLPAAQANVLSGVLGAPTGKMLAGRTICLYGLGAVAFPIAHRLRAFDVRLIGLTRDPLAPKVARFGLERCYAMHEKEICLRQTDILILCARLSDETRNAIGAVELSCLPRGSVLVNVARGGLVNYDALYASLRNGHLGGVGLDVFWHEPFNVKDPILDFENLIATPHIAGITADSLADIAAGVARNIERLRAGQPILSRVA